MSRNNFFYINFFSISLLFLKGTLLDLFLEVSHKGNNSVMTHSPLASVTSLGFNWLILTGVSHYTSALLAQSVERGAINLRVRGSRPYRSTFFALKFRLTS